MFAFLQRLLFDTPDDGGAAAPPEPRNVRDAISQRVETVGVPEFVTEPAVEAEPIVDPETADLTSIAAPITPTTEATPTTATDPFADFGGREAVQEAVVIRDALATEQGVRALVAQGLHALGHSPEAVEAFLKNQGATPAQAAAATAEAVAAADPLAGVSDDDVVTGAELKAFTQRAVEQAVAQVSATLTETTRPLQEQLQVQRQERAQTAVDGVLTELLGPVPSDAAELETYRTLAQATLTAAGAFIQQDNWDPQHIRDAVTRGHAVMAAQTEAAIQARLLAKKTAAAKLPTNIGGRTAGSEEVPEPKNLAEARAAARASGLFK